MRSASLTGELGPQTHEDGAPFRLGIRSAPTAFPASSRSWEGP